MNLPTIVQVLFGELPVGPRSDKKNPAAVRAKEYREQLTRIDYKI